MNPNEGKTDCNGVIWSLDFARADGKKTKAGKWFCRPGQSYPKNMGNTLPEKPKAPPEATTTTNKDIKIVDVAECETVGQDKTESEIVADSPSDERPEEKIIAEDFADTIELIGCIITDDTVGKMKTTERKRILSKAENTYIRHGYLPAFPAVVLLLIVVLHYLKRLTEKDDVFKERFEAVVEWIKLTYLTKVI